MTTSGFGFNPSNPQSCKRLIVRELIRLGFTDKEILAKVSAQIQRGRPDDASSAATVYVNVGSKSVSRPIVGGLKDLARGQGFAVTDFTD